MTCWPTPLRLQSWCKPGGGVLHPLCANNNERCEVKEGHFAKRASWTAHSNTPLELAAMIRRSFPLIFLAVFLWQSLAVLGPMNIAQHAGDLDHRVAHGQDANHHHHADQSLHIDGDDGPLEHLHPDTNTNTAVLLTSFQLVVIGGASFSPPETDHTAWPSHTLEGPFRPPMALA